MVWRLADALEVLRDEVNARWPNRDKASDGAIGDAAHASTGSDSDHNPWVVGSNGIGVVRAYDIDSDLDENDTDAARRLAEHFRGLGEAGDERLAGGGYVIFAGQIASERDGWVWRAYTGIDPHTSHIHLSVSRSGATPTVPYAADPATFDQTEPWGVTGSTPAQEDDDLTPDENAALSRIDVRTKENEARGEELKARLDALESVVNDAIIGTLSEIRDNVQKLVNKG